MRISLNEKRRDRFMDLYEANKGAMHKKIREWGNSPVSKSGSFKRAKRRQRGGNPTNISFMVIQEEDDLDEALQHCGTTDVREVSLRSLGKRGLQHSVASI